MARGRRTARWVGLVALLLVTMWGLYLLVAETAEIDPERDVNRLLLPVLTLALVVLALTVAVVTIRNVVRLVTDRKRGILGARLRTKLVFFYLALVLLPATILFTGSAQVIKQTVDAIVRTPIADLTRQSRQIVTQWHDYFRGESLRQAAAFAAEIRSERQAFPGDVASLERLVNRWQRQTGTHLIRVTSGGEVVVEAVDASGLAESAGADLRSLLTGVSGEAEQPDEPTGGIEFVGSTLLAHAVVPVDRAEADGQPTGAVTVAIVIPAGLAANIAGIDAVDRTYREFRVQRRDLVRLYWTLLGLIFLVTIFVATWIGLYLARRITVPIQQLAAASREISGGNLGVRVDSEVGDEMGLLVEAFNEMAGQLQENREVITRSTADLRRTNRALDERRRYIEKLLANLSTAVISLDSYGCVTTANPAVRVILGVELKPGDVAHTAFAAVGLEPLRELLDPGAPIVAEVSRRDLTLTTPSGAMNVAVQITPLGGGPAEDLGTLVMVEDLTELLRAQKAAAWREIARRIAHEIKNPLTPIQLAAQRLRKKFAEGATDLDTVLPAATASIEREVGALKQLVDEFSKFARMPEVVPREVDFVKVVESVLALYKGVPGIRWDVDLAPGLDAVLLDPEQMRRVLINLIDNAVAAMDGEGLLSISARAPVGGMFRLEVADSGPGIRPEDRDKMFSPYFSTKKRGTGLGLAIVHRVVTDHSGTIRVEEGDPAGARFVIEIPR